MARKTITIAEVSEPREKQGSKGPYKIVDVKDAEKRRYSCLKPSLFEHLKVGATIDAEVKEEEREGNDGPYTSRTIMDVFVDGQSSAPKQGGGRSYGKSPETVQYERASIEFNAAMSEVGQRVSEGKAPADIEAAYWGHLRRLLRVGLQEAHDATMLTIAQTAQMTYTPTFLDMRAEVPPDAAVAGAPIPPLTPQEGQEVASAPPDHIPGRSDDERAALLAAGAALEWTGNVSTGDGKIRPGKEWWDKFAQAAEIAKVRVALENAHKMLEEKAVGE